ncbi:MAG: hypothetical protein IJW73_06735 [Candidatus Gastranaerophilales bacterium]|nr:hypothetical protein [Candidatus Gastranaerophilales bacterium]
MKKVFIVMALCCSACFAAIDEETEAREIRKIMLKGRENVSKQERERVDRYILELAEIKVRGCTSGAKIIYSKCRNVDKLGKIVFGEQGYKEFVLKLNTK